MRETTDEALRVQLLAIRAMTPAQRLRQALELSESNRLLMLDALRARHPGLSDLELTEIVLGTRLATPVPGPRRALKATALLRTLTAWLHQAGIPFMLTGSLAAAVHGAGRATLDIDLVIAPDAEQLRALVRSIRRWPVRFRHRRA